jgi:hypothetical protein
VIDPKVEEPTRRLLGHAVRGELDELSGLMSELGPERLLDCLGLCLSLSGYIAIDVCGHKWPPDADLRRLAQLMADIDLDFNLEEPDVYDYLSRLVLGFEPLSDVFPVNKGKGVMVPILTTAALLVSYRTDARHWWEYLDVIERALEEAAPLSEAAFPAALLLSRRNRALKARG